MVDSPVAQPGEQCTGPSRVWSVRGDFHSASNFTTTSTPFMVEWEDWPLGVKQGPGVPPSYQGLRVVVPSALHPYTPARDSGASRCVVVLSSPYWNARGTPGSSWEISDTTCQPPTPEREVSPKLGCAGLPKPRSQSHPVGKLWPWPAREPRWCRLLPTACLSGFPSGLTSSPSRLHLPQSLGRLLSIHPRE